MLVAPCSPPPCVLREAEEVRKVQRACTWAEQPAKLIFIRFEVVGRIVEAAPHAGAHEDFDLRSVVVRGDEDLVVRPHCGRTQRLPEPVSSAAEEAAPRLV